MNDTKNNDELYYNQAVQSVDYRTAANSNFNSSLDRSG